MKKKSIWDAMNELDKQEIEHQCEVEEQEQEYRKDMSDAMRIVVRHILECAEELKEFGFNMDDMEV